MTLLSQVQQTNTPDIDSERYRISRYNNIETLPVKSRTELFCPAFVMTPLLQDILSTSFALTPAEIEITTLLMNGESVADVAETRACMQSTVRSQIRAIYSKTGVSSQIRFIQLVMGVKSNLSLAAAFGV